jgi:hypothetical protein
LFGEFIAGLIQQAQPLAFYIAGWKGQANKIPADPQSLFKIDRISKLYVAGTTCAFFKLYLNCMAFF